MWLQPLGLGHLHRLRVGRLALELSRPELTRVLDASGGNPYFALEIGRELARARGPITMPASLREALGGWLARLPSSCGDVLLAASASARPTVASTVAAVDQPQTLSLHALDTVAREGVVTLDRLARSLELCAQTIARCQPDEKALTDRLSEGAGFVRHPTFLQGRA